jgi:tetratricopeptide (TPR) repeat protein
MALINLQKAIYVSPKHHQAYTALGHMYRSLGDYEKALSAFRKANAFCAQYPYAPQYLFSLGQSYSDLRDKENVLSVIKDLEQMGENHLADKLKVRVFLEMSEMEK